MLCLFVFRLSLFVRSCCSGCTILVVCGTLLWSTWSVLRCHVGSTAVTMKNRRNNRCWLAVHAMQMIVCAGPLVYQGACRLSGRGLADHARRAEHQSCRARDWRYSWALQAGRVHKHCGFGMGGVCMCVRSAACVFCTTRLRVCFMHDSSTGAAAGAVTPQEGWVFQKVFGSAISCQLDKAVSFKGGG